MTNALQKVDTPLMQRYETTCVSCGWYRHFFGMEKEARESAEKMGWEFRRRVACNIVDTGKFPEIVGVGFVEDAYCPHCKLLVKEAM